MALYKFCIIIIILLLLLLLNAVERFGKLKCARRRLFAGRQLAWGVIGAVVRHQSIEAAA